MPTIYRADGFEYQVLSTASQTGVPKLYDTVQAPASIETTIVKNGSASLKLDPAGVQANVQNGANLPTGHQQGVMSFYIRFGVLPGADTQVARISAGATQFNVYFRYAATALAVRWGTGAGLDLATVTTDTWYLVDMRADTSGTTFTGDAQVDGGTSQNRTLTGQTATDINDFRLGTGSNTPTMTAYYDDWIFGWTYSEYPYGEHIVGMLSPSADGTHNNAANYIEDQAGNDIDGSTYVAYSLINEIPPENTTYVRQFTGGASDNHYAEVHFANPTETEIWGVTAYQAYASSGTTTNNGTSRIVDSSGNTLVDIRSGDMSDTWPRYTQVNVPDPGGDGWTQSELQGVKARMGFSTSAPPQPQWMSIALQYAATEAGAPGASEWSLGIPI